jgi:hypothetical protein
MTLTNLQALALAAISQIVAVAVALGLFNTDFGQIVVSAAGAVVAFLVGLFQFYENQRATAAITAGRAYPLK